MSEQLTLFQMSKSEKITQLEEALTKYGKHTLYCCWIRDGGYYDKSLVCTCGLDKAKEVSHE